MHFALAAAKTKHVDAEVFTYKDLALATNNFCKANVIGEGGFGRVYRAALESGRVAAVKQLDPKGKQGDKEFRVEVSPASSCNLRNADVILLGNCSPARMSDEESEEFYEILSAHSACRNRPKEGERDTLISRYTP